LIDPRVLAQVQIALLGLIALHVSAALFHHFWRRDDTLTAMLPAASGWRVSSRGVHDYESVGQAVSANEN
jgi:hypothetical protein